MTHRIFLALLFLLIFVTPARAAIAFVSASATCAATASATSLVVTLAASTTAGNDVAVTISAAGNPSVSTVTDSGGSSYAARASGTNSTSLKIEDWSARNVTASTTVTVTYAAAQEFTVCVEEYSGVQALGATANNSGNSAVATVSLTTQDNNNWVVAGFVDNCGIAPTANTGNLRNSLAGVGANGIDDAACDNTAASPSSVTCSVNLCGATIWAAAAFELRSTAGGGGVPERTKMGVGK